MALAVDLPRDWGVCRAHVVVAGCARGGTSVVGNVGPEVAGGGREDGATEEVRVVVVFVVDNREHLRLHADVVVCRHGTGFHQRAITETAEDAVVERRLELVGGAACTDRRVRPMDLVSLAHHHVHAVLPFVWGGELGVGRVVVAALVAPAHATRSEAAAVHNGVVVVRTRALVVVLACREVLCAKVPVHVHGAQACLEVRGHDRRSLRVVDLTHVATSDVGAGLLDGVRHGSGAVEVVEGVIGRLGTFTRIVPKERRRARSKVATFDCAEDAVEVGIVAHDDTESGAEQGNGDDGAERKARRRMWMSDLGVDLINLRAKLDHLRTERRREARCGECNLKEGEKHGNEMRTTMPTQRHGRCFLTN